MGSDLSDLAAIPGEEMLVMPPGDSDLWWYCFHTRPRREKKVAGACLEKGVRHYLPLRKSVKHYDGWRSEHMVPYFARYVFGCVSPLDCYELLRTRHVANALKVHDQEGLLVDLREIEKALQVSREIETLPFVRKGQRVRIRQGPFRGIEGVVREHRRQFRVALNISFVRRALSIELDCDDIEPV